MKENIKATTAKIAHHVNRTLNIEMIRIGLVIFLGAILALYFLPFLFNNSALKFQIAQKVSKISGANFSIAGDVKIELLPSPAIIVNEVLLQNYRVEDGEKNSDTIYNFYAKSAKIKLTVFKFSGDSTIKKIIFSNAILQSYKDNGQILKREDDFTKISEAILRNPSAKEKGARTGLTAKLFSIDGVEVGDFKSKTPPALEVENSRIIFYDKFEKKKEIAAINFELVMKEKKIIADGSFNSENLASEFKLFAKFNSKKVDSVLELNSPVARISIKGNFPGENHGIFDSEFNGKLEIEIAEIKTFYQSYISNSVSDELLQYTTKPITASADISSNATNISITNLLINSSLINGKGELDITFADKIPVIDIDLDLENLDLDALLSNEAVKVSNSDRYYDRMLRVVDDVTETLEQLTKDDGAKSKIIAEEKKPDAKEELKFDLNLVKRVKNFDLTAEIKIAHIRFLEGDIKDANLYATVSREGEIIISPLLLKIPGEGAFRVSGVLDNTGEVPKFLGKFDISGKSLKSVVQWLKVESPNLRPDNFKEYQIYSDVFLLPNMSKFSNFYLNLNEGGSEILGEAIIDNIGTTYHVQSIFQGNNLNIDDYFVTSNRSVYLTPGVLVRKLLWLNNISTSSEITLNFDRLVYKNEEFIDQSVRLSFGPGRLEVKDLKLKSDKTSLIANLQIDISDKDPQFVLKVEAENFNFKTPQVTEVVDEKSEKKTAVKKLNFFDQFFALPSLEGLRGRLDLNIANLNLDDFAVKDFKLAGNIMDGNIKSSEVTATIYGESNVVYKGMLGLGLTKVISGNLTMSNVPLQQFLPDIIGLKNISGTTNIAANIGASASKKENFADSLIGEIKFSTNAPTLAKYGLNDLVLKMFAPRTYANELREPEKILLNPESVTIFKKASGQIKINGEKGEINTTVSGLAVNGILKGTFNAVKNTANLAFNAIFITGSRQKQTPLNIASNISGDIDDLLQTTNIEQVKQYLGLTKIPVKLEEKPVILDLRKTALDQIPARKPEPFEQQKSQIIQITPTAPVVPAQQQTPTQ